ncbi:MAG: MFS transporter [Janthinobacterium lividum]
MTGARSAPSSALLLTILFLTMMEFLQSGMIAFAAGPIMGEIGAAPEQFSLATAAYACVAIVTIAKQRWLVERLGWRRFIQCSLAVFVIGSALCGSSDTFPQFLCGRIIMALGGAAFMTSGRVLINLIPPSPLRFVGIKYFATGLSVGIALAPGLASFAVAQDNWRLIFGMLMVMALCSGLLATLVLPVDLVAAELRTQSHPVIFMALASGSFMILYWLQRAQYDFFSDTTLLVAGACAGLLGLYYVVRALHRHERPLLEVRKLGTRRYLTGIVLYLVIYLLLGANNTILPFLLQRTLGFAWQTVGQFECLGLLSAVLTWCVMMVVMPRWPAAKKFFVLGFLALAAFGWGFARINGEADLWGHLLPALACNGIFIMLVMPATAMQTFQDLMHHETVFSHAQQLKNMIAQFGSALGIAVATLGLQARTAVHYGVLNERFDSAGVVYQQQLHQLAVALQAAGAGAQSMAVAAAQLSQQLTQQASLLACLDYFHFITLVGLMGATIMLVQRQFK